MMKTTTASAIVLGTTWIILAGSAAAADRVLVWPLEGPTRVTAGFCDYRTRHYHGGIDLSTGGQEGLAVHAADSGWVMRVSTSWWGYGKAVYVQLAGGGMAVYGHLSELSPEVSRFVEDAQYDARSYQQNLFPAPGEFSVARGEVIGRTGQTGVGPPHLHFELRTDGNRPINPLSGPFHRPDTVPPVIQSVTVVCRQPSDLDTPPSTVGGHLASLTVPVEKSRLELPVVTGTVGIAVLAVDYLDSRKSTSSPYRVLWSVNGQPAGEVRYDSIDYDDTRLIDLERRFDGAPGIAPRAINLFREDVNTLWHYRDLRGDGWLRAGDQLRPGPNEIEVVVEDVNGNRDRVTLALSVVDTPPPLKISLGGMGFSLYPVANGMILYLAGDSTDIPFFSLDPTGKLAVKHWIRDAENWTAWIPAALATNAMAGHLVRGDERADLDSAQLNAPWRRVTREDGGVVPAYDDGAMAVFEPEALYETAFLGLHPTEPPQKGVIIVSPAYELGPATVPFARGVRLAISSQTDRGDPAKTALYRYQSAAAGWVFEGSESDTAAGTVAATVQAAGTFALLADTTPPAIRNVTPGRGQTLTERRPLIRFELADDLSGFGSDQDVQLTVDGQWVPVEYDPDLGTAMARPRWSLEPGEHEIEIVARDRCGNENTFLRVVRISK